MPAVARRGVQQEDAGEEEACSIRFGLRLANSRWRRRSVQIAAARLGGLVTRSNVNEQLAEQRSPVEETAQLENGSQSAGVQKLHHLMKQSGGTPPDPAVVVQLLDSAPGDRHAMMIVIQQTYGNAYVQRLVSQSPPGTASKETKHADKG